jgi:UDP-glucose:(heptosyl)LPS alpha-1,3-glucosyltransferase
MRIALVCERYAPGAGGVENAVSGLARELGARELDVTLLCRTAHADPPDGVRLQMLSGPSFWQPLRLLWFSRRAARASQDFDVVHSFSRTRRQQIYRAGGGSHAAYMEQIYRHPRLQRLSPRHRAILGVEEAVFRDPTQIVQCNSHMVAREIARRYGLPDERLVVIHNGVDTERFRPRPREAGAGLRAKLEAPGPVALFLGHGFERKGLERAISGLARGGVEDACLWVAGRGDTRRFRALAEACGVPSRLRFLGPRDDTEDLYAAADLFVLPTRYDAFANSCLEAMASGLPVATTPDNGFSDLVEHGVNGFLHRDDFAPAFARLADASALAEVGRAARKTAERYTWARHADRVLELYAQVAR